MYLVERGDQHVATLNEQTADNGWVSLPLTTDVAPNSYDHMDVRGGGIYGVDWPQVLTAEVTLRTTKLEAVAANLMATRPEPFTRPTHGDDLDKLIGPPVTETRRASFPLTAAEALNDQLGRSTPATDRHTPAASSPAEQLER